MTDVGNGRWGLWSARKLARPRGVHEAPSAEIVLVPLLPPAISRVHREPYVPHLYTPTLLSDTLVRVCKLTQSHCFLGESQKAFNLLSKRLKPLEHYQPIPYDFYNLAYLTSAGTVHDAPGLRDWSGEALEREKLVTTWRELIKHLEVDGEGSGPGAGGGGGGRGGEGGMRQQVDAGRLEELLKQAGAWQIQRARQRGTGPWTITRYVSLPLWFFSS